MLVLAGLPTLFPKLVEARTYTERMFHVITLARLTEMASQDAVTRPIAQTQKSEGLPFSLDPTSVEMVVRESAGYPYFIQFICREVFDVFLQQLARGDVPSAVPFHSIQRKLDSDFFSGRWARVTDRQRDLLWVIASCESSFEEFTIQEIVEKARQGVVKGFSASQTSQMLGSLSQMAWFIRTGSESTRSPFPYLEALFFGLTPPTPRSCRSSDLTSPLGSQRLRPRLAALLSAQPSQRHCGRVLVADILPRRRGDLLIAYRLGHEPGGERVHVPRAFA